MIRFNGTPLLDWMQEAFDKNLANIDWQEVFSQYIPSEEQLRKFAPYFTKKVWDYISLNIFLSETFLKDYCDKINWESINYEFYIFDDIFIREMRDYVDWYFVTCYQKLDENIIREMEDYIDWDYIGGNQNLKDHFINEIIEKVDLGSICRYQQLSQSFIKRWKNEINYNDIK